MTGLDLELDAALRAVEAGFHVRLIATFEPQLAWAPAHAQAAAWLADNHPDFDQFPVKDGDAVVGLLLRDAVHDGRTVRDAMQALRDGMIISADTPITELIPALRDSHSRLVLRGGRIDGLVTQSDLLKLPVRMLLFGLITHLELCLRTLVRNRVSWPEWLERIPQRDRRKQVRREHEIAGAARLDPDPLEFTNFKDLLEVLKAESDLGSQFVADMEQLRLFRNKIAHAQTYVQSPDDVRKLVDRFGDTRKWIQRTSDLAGIKS
jgi:CBS domain-containing protein